MLEDVHDETMDMNDYPILNIQPDDILDIQVTSRNPEAVIAFQQNRRINSGNTAYSFSGESALGMQEGYRVDEEGNIYLPFLGRVRASGKTLVELRGEVMNDLQQYVPDAAVQMRFMSFRVTVLGEVFRPSTYIIPNERLTVLEVIGMAGDFTPYARRDSVLIVRQRSGEVREFARINTQDKSLFESPYFYLSPNDMVYVEPLKAKQYATAGDLFQRYSFIIVPLISFGTFLLGAALVK